MKKNVVIIMMITLFTKVSGFLRDVVLAGVYGTSAISDAYLIAVTIPSVFFSLIGTGIITSYIPMYNGIRNTQGSDSANAFTNNVINVMTVLATIILLIVFVYTEPIVRLFASGFYSETLNMTMEFTRITIVGIIFTGGIYVFQSFLQSNNSYIVPALMGLPANVIIIISILLSTQLGLSILPIGNLLSIIFQLLFLLPFVLKKNYKYQILVELDENIKKFLILAMPVIIGTSVNQINVLADKMIASSIVVGGISALNYANRLILFIQSIFVVAVLTITYPVMTKLIIKNEMNEFKKTISETITSINLFLVPITFGTLVLAKPIVEMLFARGAFDANAVKLTSEALFFYSIGIIGIGLREVLARAFYSMQDTRTPMTNSVIGMILNIVLNIVLSRYMGIAGIALATSISAIFTMSLMLVKLHKKIGKLGMKQILQSFIKISSSSIVMGIVVHFVFSYLRMVLRSELAVVVAILFGIIVYGIVIYNMRVSSFVSIINELKLKLGKNNS